MPNSNKREREPCDIDVEMELKELGDQDILTPLAIQNRHRPGLDRELVTFYIHIKECNSEKTTIQIMNGSATIYKEEHSTRYLTVGRHRWLWDGYSNSQVLDTRVLKSPRLKARVTVTHGGQTARHELPLDNDPEEVDWVDVKVNRRTRKVEVEMRVDLRNGSAQNLSDRLPASFSPGGGARPRRLRSFFQLRRLALSGLKKYWSRDSSNGLSINTPKGVYKVSVKPRNTRFEAMDDIALDYNTHGEPDRSSNPGTISGVQSFFAQVVPERIIYNVEWLKWTVGWRYRTVAKADDDFTETAAHEIGHEILKSYGGTDYSYGHKGSSTVLTQETKPVVDGGVSYPSSGEIDLMKYYNGRASNFYQRVVAAEEDVEGLIWLSRVDFDD